MRSFSFSSAQNNAKMKSLSILWSFSFIFVSVVADFNSLESTACPTSSEESEESTRVVDECIKIVEASVYAGLHLGVPGGMMHHVETLRRKRETYNADDLSPADKRVGGLEDGLPTRHGLVRLATEGSSHRTYNMAAIQFVDQCSHIIENFRQDHTDQKAFGGEVCDVIYQTFECIILKVDEFCNVS